MSLLAVRGLRVSFAGGRVPALLGVDLTVRHGQTVAVVGESGSGKTTLARTVLGLLPSSARVLGGSVEFGGRNLLALGERGMRAVRGRSISLVPQDPTAALNPVVPVGAQVAEVLRVHGLASRRDARRRAVELLEVAGFPDAGVRARQYPHELSGGMRQRVLIAAALAGRPDLIVADEPTSALDPTVQRQVLDHLTELTRSSGTALVLITHDLGIAAERAEHVVVMADGEVVEEGPPARVLDAPDHPRTRRLVADAPSLNSTRLNSTLLGPSSAIGETLLDVQGLTKVFTSSRFGAARKRITAVADVAFTVARGETLALVGESGAGKSTVARLLVRLEDATAGRILFDGADLAALRGEELRRFRRRVQLVFQDPFTCLDPRYTAFDLIAEPLRAFGLDASPARVHELAEQVALPVGLLSRRPGELSGGQCQRVAIARAVAPGPDLLVCDEPASSLDISVQAQVLRLLVDLQASLGLSLVFISHDLAVVRQVADRVAVLQAGRIVETGPADQVLTAPDHPHTRALLSAVPHLPRREPA
ncbi:ABC transporter ATP-binding protein [Saccharothrix sp.]|uniref:ABC transporter ATP-binding protein n=1 Tax=Saccharothrix sp. TaxID=1873460 RepID=UPI0028128077|nr:ABC transporter ATP-binding protein [Saccharothrix sp.]